MALDSEPAGKKMSESTFPLSPHRITMVTFPYVTMATRPKTAHLANTHAGKRTRQNLAKMQARKERNLANPTMKDVGEDKTLQAQAKAAERRGLPLDKYLKLRESGAGKNAIRASRRKKKADIREQRAAAATAAGAAAVADEMDMC